MPIPSQSPAPHLDPFEKIALAVFALLFLIGLGSGFAENPWTSSTLGWSSSFPSRHWSSWETTTGGTFTFGGSFSSHGDSYAPPSIVRNADIDPVMLKAGSIAEHRAQPRPTMLCWRYVKEALVAAGSVTSYPQTNYAREAGRDLVRNFGFVQLNVSRPERAPVGSVIVYGGAGAGHVELRTAHSFVSDYRCNQPSGLPFIGAFARVEKRHKGIRTAQIAAGANSRS